MQADIFLYIQAFTVHQYDILRRDLLAYVRLLAVYGYPFHLDEIVRFPA